MFLDKGVQQTWQEYQLQRDEYLKKGVTKFFEGQEPPQHPMDRHFLDERADIEILGEENITSVEADHLAQDTTNDPNWWKGIVDAQKD